MDDAYLDWLLRCEYEMRLAGRGKYGPVPEWEQTEIWAEVINDAKAGESDE